MKRAYNKSSIKAVMKSIGMIGHKQKKKKKLRYGGISLKVVNLSKNQSIQLALIFFLRSSVIFLQYSYILMYHKTDRVTFHPPYIYVSACIIPAQRGIAAFKNTVSKLSGTDKKRYILRENLHSIARVASTFGLRQKQWSTIPKQTFEPKLASFRASGKLYRLVF